MINIKDIKLSLWYPIKEERQPIIKQKINEILNQLLSENFSEEEMKEIVMNCRGNLSSYLSG